MRFTNALIAGGLLGIFVIPPRAFADSSVTDKIAGVWEVIEAVPTTDNLHAAFREGDPSFTHRVLNVTKDSLAYNDGSGPCTGLVLKAGKPALLSRVLGKLFPQTDNKGKQFTFELDQYGLKEADQSVVPLRTACALPQGADAQSFPNNSTFAVLNGGNLLATYNDIAIMVLRRLPDGVLKPSFNCAKASSPTEQKICSSAGLSGYDRSIADAYRRLLKGAPDVAVASKQEQTAFTKKRDACGSNEACLQQAMIDRLSEISQSLDGVPAEE